MPNNELAIPPLSHGPRPRRLFFALWPEAELQQELNKLAGEVLGPGNGRRVVPENIHLTLAFLGSVTEAVQACYERAATEVHGARFTFTLDRLGCFRRTGVLWAGAAPAPEPLVSLVQALHRALAGCGYTPENRAFQAHVTIARKVRPCPVEAPLPPMLWSVNRFSLVQSHTHADGARYEIVRTWELG
jgi:2'-5' RNA ligase